MAEGFGRWESDPLFPAAECVQDSADRMDGVYRLLLHEKKVIQDDTSDAKLHAPIQYERDVATALGTTKWQLEQFEREVNAAAFSDKSTSRENAILKFRQFIRAIAEQISEVEESLKTLRTDFSRTPKSPYSSSEQDGDGLASFLSGGNSHSHAYYSTDTNEITELKLDSAPMVNGYHSAQEHTTRELRYSGNDVEGASKLQCSRGESASEGDHNGSTLCSLDADDSLGTSHHYKNKLSSQYRSFMRNLWFTNRDHQSFTKRRKDGEVVDGLRNGNILPPFNLRTSGRTTYCWPELIKRTLSRSEYSTCYNHPQLFVATSLLVALAVLGEYFCACCYVSYIFLHVQNFRSIDHIP
uniref:Syntaxin 6/10/61 N-terminal domain-containing protein n=1 Tax=Triticum urartu TaxID=4572 RepID=A0A8R7P2A8_TRIUA